MNEILKTAWRAAIFDRNAFGDWLYSASATGDAALLVIGVAGLQIVAALVFGGARFGDLVITVLQFVLSALAGWVFLAVATWFAGTRWFNGSGDMQAIMRMHGLAYLPNALSAAAFVVAGFGQTIAIAGYVWHLAAAVVGTSVGLSQKTRDAVLSVLVGAAVILVIQVVFGAAIGAAGIAFSGF